MILLTIVATPEPDAPESADVGGAYVNAWIKSTEAEKAERIAKTLIVDSGWSPGLTTDVSELGDPMDVSEDEREYFEEAARTGYCLVFHQWPKDADDSSAEFEIN
ncbi:MAG: hypothetical protein QNJ05_14780 [Woeseiaceae bacterium]|nr:hypothetical protein [Woeseiaceae bacterium]